MQVKGERNAMFIVALYLVIKEHKICLRLFLCEHSLMTDVFLLSWAWGGVHSPHVHPHAPPFLFFLSPSWPTFLLLLSLHLLCLYFAPPACLCPVRFRHLYL